MQISEPEAITKLSRDLRDSIKTEGGGISRGEARFLVDAYYMLQEDRIRAGNQFKALAKDGEPHAVIQWLFEQSRILENQIKTALDVYSDNDPVGRWARSVHGIGPVIAAGLLAHIDIEKAPTVGHIWSFAGLDPRQKWEKGQKRPWNATLKTLCWKIGESFVKVSGNEDAFYGQVYKQRKELETQRNEAGEFAQQAADILATKRIGKTTDAYKAYSIGKLPPAHIHARAKRYAVKLFLSGFHEIAFIEHFGYKPPLPYPMAILGHAHKIEPPQPA